MTKARFRSLLTKLANRYRSHRIAGNREMNEAEERAHYATEEELQTDLAKLMRIDSDFSLCTRRQILILIRLNLNLRAVPLHTVGGGIDLAKLIGDH